MENKNNVNIDVEILKQIHKDRLDLYVRKNNDYGNSIEKNFLEFGEISILIRMCDKIERLKSLTKGNQQMVLDESYDDTVDDLATYADLLKMLRIKHRYKKEGESKEVPNNPYTIRQQEESSYGQTPTI